MVNKSLLSLSTLIYICSNFGLRAFSIAVDYVDGTLVNAAFMHMYIYLVCLLINNAAFGI